MTMNTERELGRVEGRVEEQSAAIARMHDDMTAGFARLDSRIDSRIDGLRSEMTEGFAQVNTRIDRLYLALLGIGGALLTGLIVLIVRSF